VDLSVLVVDSASGRPIPGAEVEIIRPIDDERQPVKGRTDVVGRVVLCNLFYASRTSYLVGATDRVRFSPFVIRVTAEDFSEFCAHLAPSDDRPYPYKLTTAPPMNLTYPVPGPVKISLSRKGG
jgi:hypothetical protein